MQLKILVLNSLCTLSRPHVIKIGSSAGHITHSCNQLGRPLIEMEGVSTPTPGILAELAELAGPAAGAGTSKPKYSPLALGHVGLGRVG